jgi:hypothetical protein
MLRAHCCSIEGVQVIWKEKHFATRVPGRLSAMNSDHGPDGASERPRMVTAEHTYIMTLRTCISPYTASQEWNNVEKELRDRAESIQKRIVQLRDSL